MGSSAFFGLNVARQGLFAAKTGLDITNHNITNANTKGYSRQIINQQASRPLPDYTGRGMIGTGTDIISIDSMRNEYYDLKYRSVNNTYGEYDIKNTYMNQMELIFNEKEDFGFGATYNEFFNQLSELSKNPTEDINRTTFIDSAINLTSYFNSLSEELTRLQQEVNTAVKTEVDHINDLAQQLSSVNGQIEVMELNGSRANDLRDKRSNIIDELTKIVTVDVKEINESNNMNRFVVAINGNNLVDGTIVNSLHVEPRDTFNNPEDTVGLYDVYWDWGQQLNVYDEDMSGNLVGYIQVRDGNNLENFDGVLDAADISIDLVTNNINTVTIKNISRNDIKEKGQLIIDNQVVDYSSFVYNSADNSITFTLDNTSNINGTNFPLKVEIGNDIDYKGIPFFISRLNNFVRTFSKAVNDIHVKGENLNGDFNQLLFSYKDFGGNSTNIDYNQVTARNFAVDHEIVADIKKIATTYDINNELDNNDIIIEIFDLKEDIRMFEQGKPESYYHAVLSNLAITSKQANNFTESQENMLHAIENQRTSYSSVDMNEETTNIVKYQYAYNIAAKMISVMDEIYDVTINRMGL